MALNGSAPEHRQRIRVLALARNYPNNEFERLGLWTERLVQSCLPWCETKVIAPVPYFPPLPGFPQYARYRRIARHRQDRGVEVFHPRFPLGPGMWLHPTEAGGYYQGVARHVARLRKIFQFDLIHAHFIFPDGCVAARLGRRFGVPVIITEQASWRPWLDNYPSVRRQALRAVTDTDFIIAVSNALKTSIASFGVDPSKLRVIPNVVDGSVFTLPTSDNRSTRTRLLFVGIMRMVKGLDVLLKAMRILLDRGHDLELAVVGESFYEAYRRDHEQFKQLLTTLNLERHVSFLGGKPAPEVAAEMRASTMLILPSRRETFGAVLAEALACGIPVVATRCGGPEDIVNEKVGVLVPVEDPEGLAKGIEEVLSRRATYIPGELRAYSLNNFGLESVGRRLVGVYNEALTAHRRADTATAH